FMRKPGYKSQLKALARRMICMPADFKRSPLPPYSFTADSILAPNPANWRPSARSFRMLKYASLKLRLTARTAKLPRQIWSPRLQVSSPESHTNDTSEGCEKVGGGVVTTPSCGLC